MISNRKHLPCAPCDGDVGQRAQLRASAFFRTLTDSYSLYCPTSWTLRAKGSTRVDRQVALGCPQPISTARPAVPRIGPFQ